MLGKLILSRKANETIHISGPCEIEIVRIAGNRVTVMVRAERRVLVLRGEVVEKQERKSA